QVKARHTGTSTARWAVIGAGYTGLAAARLLAEHFSHDEVILIEAQEVGYGTAGRNAGFAIDLPHDIGAEDYIGDIEIAKTTLRLNLLGQSLLQTQVKTHGIDCHMRSSGKYQGAVENRGIAVLEAYQRGLDKLGQDYQVISEQDLPNHIGTSFYKKALFTPGTILLQPSALVKGLADSLPSNVTLYENTAITEVEYGDKVVLKHENGLIIVDKLILANNAFGQRFGFSQIQRTMLPVFLYASMTRPLTETEQAQLGGKDFWGVIPSDPFGST
ncbi:FAD-binding oxidoreductase, partial [Enterobacter kobei]|uniref:NAD(P)/FAD-dependent oxidoreductase n=1 Tax=Enterobacter kobei TaxID=208224 RepID=UPI002DB9D2AF